MYGPPVPDIPGILGIVPLIFPFREGILRYVVGVGLVGVINREGATVPLNI